MIWKASVNVFLIALISMCIGMGIGRLDMCIGMGIGRLDLMSLGDLWLSATFLLAALLFQVFALSGQLLELKRMALMATAAGEFS